MRGKKANQLKLLSLNSPPHSIPTTHACRTAAPADVIVDLSDGLEDSEYEDFEDEFNV